MRKTYGRRAAVRGARLAVLGAGVLLLAGCATGYSLVQPDVAGAGGYYTGNAPYTGQGYYDDYGTGPYFPGTSGYGYYNGGSPYSNAYGYYDGGYPYGPQWTFNLGISNVWNFPGYWGPWYTTGFPLWGCNSWHCGNRHHHRGDHGDHHHDGAWKQWDRSPAAPSDLAGVTHPEPGTFADRRARAADLSAFRHDHFVRAPRLQGRGSLVGRLVSPIDVPSRMANGPAFASPRIRPDAAAIAVPVTHPFSGGARPAPPPPMRSMLPARAAPPVAQPPARHDGTPQTKIR